MLTRYRVLLPLLLLSLLAPGAAPAADPAPAPAGAPLTLSITEAILMSLQNNRSLRVQRFGPAVSRTGELRAAAPFDLNLAADASSSWDRTPAAAPDTFQRTDKQTYSLGANRLYPTGTTVGVDLGTTRTGGDPESDTTRLGVSLTQALLQGRGADANLAVLRQARLDTAISTFELRGYTADFVAQVEQACWDYLLAGRRIEIVERSLRLAQEQLDEVRERIAVGRVAEIEAAAAEAEAAARREALINARSTLATARLRLLRLINPPGPGALGWELQITDLPALPPADDATIEAHVTLAGRLRPDLAQARLQLERGELEVVSTRNGLLPKLDLFVTLGKTGYASSFGSSFDAGTEGYDVQAGLTLRFPWENRAARAAGERARLSRDQATAALENLAQLAEVDVRGALIEIRRLREQAAATAVNLHLQEEKLRAETEKFRVGKSTAFLVAQAQRDLLQAETDSVSAVAECLKAVVELYRLEGSLLERRGITVAE
jgi:outer membrane protein TolC